MKPASTIVISGYYGYNNIGDEAILTAIIHGFQEWVPEARFCVLTGKPNATSLMHPNIDTIDRLELDQVIECIAKADVVIQGGGGLYHDYYGFSLTDVFQNPPQGMALYAMVPLVAAMLNKPCMMYAQGIGPLFSTEAREFLRFICQAFNTITVRDEESRNLLREIGVWTDVLVTADPAFTLTPSPNERVRQILKQEHLIEVLQSPTLGVCVRPWHWTANPEIWEKEIATAMDMFLEKYPLISILFIPFQLNHAPDENDLDVADRIRSRMKFQNRIYTLRRLYKPEETLGIVGKCALVLGMRLHALIFAALTGTAMVGLSYDPKVTHLMRRLGYQNLNIELRDCTADMLFHTLEAAWHNKREIENEVQIRAQELRKLAARNVTVALQLFERSAQVQVCAQDFETLDELPYLSDKHEKRTIQAQLLTLKREFNEMKTSLAKQKAQIAGFQHIIPQQMENLYSLQEELYRIHTSKWWKFASLYWALQQSAMWLPRAKTKFRSFIKNISRKRISWRSKVSQKSQNEQLSLIRNQNSMAAVEGAIEFLQQMILEREPTYLFLIFSGTRFNDDEGQRPTRLARELARRGIPVVFAYWRWLPDEPIEQSDAFPLVYQIPIDQMIRFSSSLFTLPIPTEVCKVFLMEFPHPYLFELVNLANAYGWYTVYDVLDDWEEFHQVGQAIWYDRSIEEYIIRNVDVVTVVSKPLERELRRRGVTNLMHLPNAIEFNGWSNIGLGRKPMRNGLLIGYFGHLTEAWFDWKLVMDLATNNPEWNFELIGYGEPNGLNLPNNIKLLGRTPHKELPKFASRWNVAIIPFKPSRLVAAADPIKVYEYLYLQLPVVVTGIPHLADIPYVWVANDSESFERLIIQAASTQLDSDTVAAFVSKNTWSTRINTLLDWIENRRSRSLIRQALQI